MNPAASKPVICIGIAGGTCSGKSRLVKELQAALGANMVGVAQDWYYNDNAQVPLEARQKINYDHPDAIEWPLLIEQVAALKRGESVQAPEYDFPLHTRTAQPQFVLAAPVVILEGILVLHHPQVRPLLDVKIFIDVDEAVRQRRRVERNLIERGRTLEQINFSYEQHVLPMHQQFVEPSRAYADIVWRQLEQPDKAAEIAAYIRTLLEKNITPAPAPR